MNKFLFDKSFDAARQKEQPKEPTFTTAEVETFKTVAFEDGYNKAQASIEQQLQELAQQIAIKLEAIQQQHSELDKKYRGIAHDIAGTTIKAVLPGAVDQFGFDEVKQIINQAFDKLSDAGSIKITVNPEIQGKVEEFIQKADKDQNCRIIVDKNFAKTDCLVETNSGSMERYFETVWQDIEKILKDYHPSEKHNKSLTKDEQIDEQQGAE